MNRYTKITIDSPQTQEPLEKANYLGEIISDEEKHRIEEECKKVELLKESKIAEKKAEEELEKQKEIDYWGDLNEDQINLIKKKVEQTREQIKTEFETKKIQYKEKIDAARESKPIKKK